MITSGYSTRSADHRGHQKTLRRAADAPRRGTGRRLAAPFAGVALGAALLLGGGSAAVAQETGADGASLTAAGDASDENLFEGTWNFGYTEKTLTAEELGDVVEAKAEARGPDEMSLTVQCADGIDTSIGDYVAICVAIADEGVEHPWKVTGGPADAGLAAEVENLE